MGRAVLAEADGIVRHHVDDAAAHQRRQADRAAGIVGEHQEGAAVGMKPPCRCMPFMAAAMPCSRMP